MLPAYGRYSQPYSVCGSSDAAFNSLSVGLTAATCSLCCDALEICCLSTGFNNNNNSHDNVYGAVIMTKVIARVHPVYLMNVDLAPGGHQPSDQASRLGL